MGSWWQVDVYCHRHHVNNNISSTNRDKHNGYSYFLPDLRRTEISPRQSRRTCVSRNNKLLDPPSHHRPRLQRYPNFFSLFLVSSSYSPSPFSRATFVASASCFFFSLNATSSSVSSSFFAFFGACSEIVSSTQIVMIYGESLTLSGFTFPPCLLDIVMWW